MSSPPHLAFGRHPERGTAEMAAIHAILDAEIICHAGFSVDGWPYVVPTVHARDGDRLLIHGSTLSRMLGALAGGVPLCVTVTSVDGIVCARSVFNHSINYRSAMVFGRATAVVGDAAKTEALRAIVEHVLPGRWDEARKPSRSELKATEIVALPIEAATAKVRSGPPVDAPRDRDAPMWAGVIPRSPVPTRPVMIPGELAGLPLPASVAALLASR
jgi:nitroimidazol reductase NimA-like FMN-containing flavoprotein (pyridoxamine 5'-phosphate oxidase superfamily)